MDLRRLKTIFIFVLALMNIVFCAIIYNAQTYEKKEQQIMTESLNNLLAKDMIYLSPRLELPKAPTIYRFYLEKSFGNNDDLIKRFLGDSEYTAHGNDYSNETGRLHLIGDEFKFYNLKPTDTITDFSEKNIERLCREEMERLGIFSELYVFSGINFPDDGVTAIFTVQHEDFAFFDAYISFDVGSRGITSISGRNMLSGLETSRSESKFFNIMSILTDLSNNPALEKNVVHSIVSITPGYYIGKTAESYRNILAIPVWQIATDTGKILYYDARNGKRITE